jgi:hypothetical protein
VLSVLGYDFQRWEQGFDSLESIFEFVASSPYYSSNIFDDPYGYRNVPADTRLTTRLSMAKWVDQNPVKVPPFKSTSEETGRTQRDLGQCLARIEESFGGKDRLTAWVLGASPSDIERKILDMHAAA